MADAIDEIERLRHLFLRSAVVGLALLYFGLSGLTSAMRNVDGAESAQVLAAIKDIDHPYLDASYVFSRQIAALPVVNNAPQDDKKLHETEDRLEALAARWFLAEIDVLGTKIALDLRIVAPLLPLFVGLLCAYLWVIHRKISILEQVQVAAATNPTQVWGTPAFRRHPHLLVQVLVVTVGAVLTAWLVTLLGEMSVLITPGDQIDYANALICVAAYVILYVSYATRVLRGHSRGGWTDWLHQRVATLKQAVMVKACARRPRVQLGAGAVLVLLTLILPIATESCGPSRHTGLEYADLTNEDPSWFNSEWPVALTDLVMRPLYVALLLVSAGSLVGSLRPWRPFVNRAPSRKLRCATMLCRATVVLAVCSICFCTRSSLGIGNVVCAVFWIVITIWLWCRRRDPAARNRLTETVILVMTPPALTFGVQGARYLYQLGLVGVPVLVIGGLLQLRIYAFLRAEQTSSLKQMGPTMAHRQVAGV